jgi:hypothetical protein
MKIILTYPDMGEESEEIIIRWIKDKGRDLDIEYPSPLRYVIRVEVER